MSNIKEEELFKIKYNNLFKKVSQHKSCLCSSSNKKNLFKLDRYNLSTSVCLCKDCGLVYSDLTLPDDEMKKFYSSDAYRYFYNYIDKGLKNKSNHSSSFIEDIHDIHGINNSLSLICENYLHKKNELILEFGSGYAQLSRSLPVKGKLIAIDYSKNAVNFLRKLNIEAYQGGIKILGKINKKFDLIILSHVVEHFQDFNKELKEILKYLKDDGLVYIEVPNLDNKYNLDQIQNAHNYYFTTNTLIYYCSKLGLKIKKKKIKINKFNLGVLFSKSSGFNYSYNSKNEIYKIIKLHKKFLNFNNYINRYKIILYELIKKILGINITTKIRNILRKLKW